MGVESLESLLPKGRVHLHHDPRGVWDCSEAKGREGGC